MRKLYKVGDFCFALDAPDGLTPPPNFEKFAVDGPAPAYHYVLRLAGPLPAPEGRLLARRPDLMVFGRGGLEQRLVGAAGAPEPYALYRETAANRAEIFLRPSWLGQMGVDTLFTALFALERRLLDRDGLVLHCAYLRHQGEAILFSAPSETGKSTQAGLWEQYRGSRTINGDRSLLQKVDGRWTARGWPVCGSSEICTALDTPIRAVVMLSQGQDNLTRRLSPGQAFSLLYSQITINRWDPDRSSRAMDRIGELVQQVPVYHLSCTISRQAVECLEAALFPRV